MANYKYKKEDFISSSYSLKDYELVLICEALDFADRHNLFTGEDEFIADNQKKKKKKSKDSSKELMEIPKNHLHKK